MLVFGVAIELKIGLFSYELFFEWLHWWPAVVGSLQQLRNPSEKTRKINSLNKSAQFYAQLSSSHVKINPKAAW